MSRSRIAIFGLLALIAALGVIPGLLPSAHVFGPIVYSSRGALCSINYPTERQAFCLTSSFANPSFSPNGQNLAAVSTTTSFAGHPSSKIVVFDRSGKSIGALSESDAFVRPVWSPDGNYIYAVVDANHHASVGRWRWPSGDRALLPVQDLEQSCNKIDSLSLSPAGDRAVLLCNFKQLYLAEVRSDLFRVERELPLQFSYVSSPKWFDESHLLAIARLKEGEVANLWRIDSATGLAEIVPTPELALRDYVTVSPDNKAIIVTGSRRQPLKWRLWHIDLSDKKQTELTGGDEDVAATWTR
jgi:dipeptidyl aminopeptidase/acylaminoacyl peptidase